MFDSKNAGVLCFYILKCEKIEEIWNGSELVGNLMTVTVKIGKYRVLNSR